MILDSNIIIYSVIPENYRIRDFLKTIESELSVSVISKIEVLGYHKLSPDEKILFEEFFHSINIIPIDDLIIDRAIKIRQNKKITLGDCIIAATAQVNNKKLFTNNDVDFEGIVNINIISMKSILT